MPDKIKTDLKRFGSLTGRGGRTRLDGELSELLLDAEGLGIGEVEEEEGGGWGACPRGPLPGQTPGPQVLLLPHAVPPQPWVLQDHLDLATPVWGTQGRGLHPNTVSQTHKPPANQIISEPASQPIG